MMECLQRHFPNQQIKLLYDVSCTLRKHLQVCNEIVLKCAHACFNTQANSRDDLLAIFQLAIPIFHCYGHKLKCQVRMYIYVACRHIFFNIYNGQLLNLLTILYLNHVNLTECSYWICNFY